MKSLAAVKVDDLPETPTLIKRQPGTQYQQPKLKALPREASNTFEEMKVLGFDAIGNVDPWAPISDSTIVELWNSFSPDCFPINLKGNNDKIENFTLVEQLVCTSCKRFYFN